MLTYKQAIDYLYNQRPAFERQGAGGYKPGLATTMAIDDMCGNPHRNYRIIHIAGTNGKGSVSSLIAAVLQSQGYKVGLYTSPHFVDFSERIKVNGECIPHDRVCEWVTGIVGQKTSVEPSFFELTTILAFQYFAECKVDFAVVEVGLGGRLDSTNIVSPMLSVITNISLDHTEFLGNTLAEIAREKAGIIKPGVPVVVGEASGDVREAISAKAQACGSKMVVAQEITASTNGLYLTVHWPGMGDIDCQLTGDYQKMNAATALSAIGQLRNMGIKIDDNAVRQGFAHVCDLTSFRGRWTVVSRSPLTICDSAHNTAGITCAMKQLASLECNSLHMVVGFMADKDLKHILQLLPPEATYYFTQASTPRAMNAPALAEIAASHGLKGECYTDVKQAHAAALHHAGKDDIIYVGGSMYVLAEFFELMDRLKGTES